MLTNYCMSMADHI